MRFAKRSEGLADARRVVVGAARSSAQDDVAVGIAARRDDAGQALLGDADEAVRMGCRAHRIDGDLDAALGSVLEAHRHGEPRGELAVDLALGRSRPDRPPGDQVGDELGRDRVEELASGRQSEADQIEQQAAREA